MNLSKFRLKNDLTIKGEYIFIDIDTTGIRPKIDKIIKIYLYFISDGIIQNEWDRTINPGIDISLHVQKTTGISNEIVKDAPFFSDIAKELFGILKNKILVAHNARFDYAFLKNEFKQCNFAYEEQILCLVRLSRIFFPETQNHSLASIQERLKLNYKDKNSIYNKVETLFHFFYKLQEITSVTDLNKIINQSLKSQPISYLFALEYFQKIPNSSGVYRFYDENDNCLYMGSCESLRDKIISYFKMEYTNFNKLQFIQQVKRIDWIETIGKLGALLREKRLLKKNIPLFNRILSKAKKIFTIKLVKNKDNYLCLKVVYLSDIRKSEIKNTFGIFKSKKQAENRLKEFIKKHCFCFHINNFTKGNNFCFRYKIQKCKGACGNQEPFKLYNERMNIALSDLGENLWPYVGNIAIKECDAKNSKTFEYHIIDKWCYLGSVKKLDINVKDSELEMQIDIDVYNILSTILVKKQNKMEIFEIN